MDSQITCYGGSDGKGHINVTSSLKPNDYLWTNVIAVDSFLNHLSAGNYYGIYKYINHAGNACDQNFNFIIPQPDSMYMKIISMVILKEILVGRFSTVIIFTTIF